MDSIRMIEVLPLTITREVPYLGPLERSVRPSESGLFIRPGNRTVYSTADHSVLVKVTTYDGVIGWGECVSPVAPGVAAAVLRDLVGPLVVDRDPHDVVAIYEDLYDAMRVRGHFGGFYMDALAALDIALWDIRGKLTGLPLRKLLGSIRHERIPAYVSGLPCSTIAERAALARQWVERGFSVVKFAGAVAHEGELAEMRAIREAVGPDVKILADLHWRYTAPEAIRIIRELEGYGLFAAEAPVRPEDIDGLADVARAVQTPIAIGEELRTVHEFLPRFNRRCMSIVQPEMGRTGITGFLQICQLAQAFHCRVMPHATIGIGIFLAASLQVSATLSTLGYHEYQHSIFDRYQRFISGTMACQEGYYALPDGPGLGVVPREEMLVP